MKFQICWRPNWKAAFQLNILGISRLDEADAYVHRLAVSHKSESHNV
ncbi:MAG TPA: hypothetical protein VJQ59_17100 [Candidatus Sulfotelmatobacter sp.]|nr:hypothetical protein [Candidatus Sulfotelmatobacter sp.]